MNDPHNPYFLFTLLMGYAPDSEARIIAIKYYQDMINCGLSPEYKVIQLAGSLIDGLSYDNWPWSPIIKEEEEEE